METTATMVTCHYGLHVAKTLIVKEVRIRQPDYRLMNQVLKSQRRKTETRCMGQIAKRYCRYCSQACPSTSVCVLISLLQHIHVEKIQST